MSVALHNVPVSLNIALGSASHTPFTAWKSIIGDHDLMKVEGDYIPISSHEIASDWGEN